MPEKKVTRVVKKKRKLKVKNIIILLLILFLIGLLLNYVMSLRIRNIYVIGNDILSDKVVIEDAKLMNYPTFLLTKSQDIRNNLIKNDYVKSVNVTKNYMLKVYIEIEENKVLAKNNDDKLILENGKIVDNIYNLMDVPVLINDVSDVIDDFCNYFSLVDKTILTKISQIEYVPNNVDNMRFLLYMNDGNYVYVTLTKIDKLNKYNSIKDQLGDNEGIVYLDSGDYFEIKDSNDYLDDEEDEENNNEENANEDNVDEDNSSEENNSDDNSVEDVNNDEGKESDE